ISIFGRDWQTYFVFLNLVGSPLAIGFMLFHESPRWLIARNHLNDACTVLNDLAHERWNNTKAKFKMRDISTITKTQAKLPYYTLFSLFTTRRLAKQTFMQFISAFTYSIVSSTYVYATSGIHNNAIMYTFLDGVFRILTPLIIVFFDYRFKSFGRKIQFIGALPIEAILYAIVIVLVAVGYKYNDTAVIILIIVTTMINDCVFWINILQVTTQRYPSVIRGIAFGFIQSVKHFGSIVGVIAIRPVLKSYTLGAFIISSVFILITLVLGFFLQPETQGKALNDQMVEANYGRLENTIPKALIKLAAGYKVMQIERREELRKEMEAVEAAVEKGKIVDSSWMFKGQFNQISQMPSSTMVPQEEIFELEIIMGMVSDWHADAGSEKEFKMVRSSPSSSVFSFGFIQEKERKFNEKELELEQRSRRNSQISVSRRNSKHSGNVMNPSRRDNDVSDFNDVKM
ncbi:hypothetical protein PENTCL1PPCAC_30131, partial [Pristionchus entomophagus]